MKKAASLLCLAVLFLMLGGCQMIRIEEENKTPLAYTVIEDSQIPEEMQELIREKKETEFQNCLSEGNGAVSGKRVWSTDEWRIQHSGKRTFCIFKCSFFETKLIGPTEKIQGGEPSYPYIVIKTEYRDGPVQFQ